MDILNFRALDFIMKLIRFEGIFDLSTDVPDLALFLLLDDSRSDTSCLSVSWKLHWYFKPILGAKSIGPKCFEGF